MLFETHAEMLRNILSYIKTKSERVELDVKKEISESTGSLSNKIETLVDNIFMNIIPGEHVAVSPDIMAIISTTSKVILNPVPVSQSYYINLPNAIYPINGRRIYLYRDIYAHESYMLGTSKRAMEGIIFVPGIGYRKDDNDIRFGVNINNDNDNMSQKTTVPYAVIDKSRDGMYKYLTFNNVQSLIFP